MTALNLPLSNRGEARLLVSSAVQRTAEHRFRYIAAVDLPMFLDERRIKMLLADGIRGKGPLPDTFYPWNVIDYMVMDLSDEPDPKPSPDDHMLFSRRKKLAERAERWCVDNGAAIIPLNIVTALVAIGALKTEESTP